MHKNKDGTVVASLTEVKNRTGDIFALVDEFGEVFLTSYNKIRYRISKTDLSNVIELKEKAPAAKKTVAKKGKPAPKAKTVAPVETIKVEDVVVEEPIAEVAPVVEAATVQAVETVEEQPQAEDDFASRIAKYVSWDRNSKTERNFVDKSQKPLVSN
jgi:hypothetical protein